MNTNQENDYFAARQNYNTVQPDSTATAPRQPWMVRRSGQTPRLRLYCFPYAGGGAHIFSQWHQLLPPEIEICAAQLPGRGPRFAERPATDLRALVQDLVQAMPTVPPVPFAFFGHSMGGLLSYELARELHRLGRPLPSRLIISGCSAPGYPRTGKVLHRLENDELIEELRSYNGTPAEILENVELLELLLPIIRADFSLVESYAFSSQAPLDVPISLLSGADDPHVNRDGLAPWAAETIHPVTLDMLPGDHFFISSHAEQVIAHVEAILKARQGTLAR